MEYFKRMPLLLGLGSGVAVGMFFLYSKRPLSEVYQYLTVAIVVFYFIGYILKNIVVEIYDNYQNRKKYQINMDDKEGDTENLANNDTEKTVKNKLDIKIDGKDDSSFVEMKDIFSTEQK